MTGSACAVSHKVLGWTAFAVMVAGLVITIVPLLGNQATVLFTFYPPMKARGAISGIDLGGGSHLAGRAQSVLPV
jgi:heme/copper-type cytochrome/quinol oxidase subunit 1